MGAIFQSFRVSWGFLELVACCVLVSTSLLAQEDYELVESGGLFFRRPIMPRPPNATCIVPPGSRAPTNFPVVPVPVQPPPEEKAAHEKFEAAMKAWEHRREEWRRRAPGPQDRDAHRAWMDEMQQLRRERLRLIEEETRRALSPRPPVPRPVVPPAGVPAPKRVPLKIHSS
jgi:hypothetical protein